MASAIVTTRLNVNDPVKEVVVLTLSAADTYISKEFGSVTAVQATLMEDTSTLDIPVSCSISGAIVTIHCSGASTILASKKVCLTLYGKR